MRHGLPGFWTQIDFGAPTGCWNWMGFKNADGYGRRGARLLDEIAAHRIAYRACVGHIYNGMELDHTCSNRACVNPSHLEQVTHAENNRRAALLKTTCRNGHPKEAARRQCRICQREREAEYRAANRERLRVYHRERRALARSETP